MGSPRRLRTARLLQGPTWPLGGAVAPYFGRSRRFLTEVRACPGFFRNRSDLLLLLVCDLRGGRRPVGEVGKRLEVKRTTSIH